ncbi:transposase [Tenacibaculum tangerinum]|uniref:transposase n=1 Tax=Tenacibaculum tangerinum TaxID=3038772 RepID=UPI00389AB405
MLAKNKNDWTQNQKQRAKLLFNLYAKIERAYKHTLEFRGINEGKEKVKAKQRFEYWF